MGTIVYEDDTNLENTLQEFLSDLVTSEDIKVVDDNGQLVAPEVRVGFKYDASQTLPVISLYVDSTIRDRAFVGSNRRSEEFLIIIDIRALNDGMQKNLARWVMNKINDGFTFYEYTPNGNNPTKSSAGYVSVDFISNVAVRLGEDAHLLDKYRQNITISCMIHETS